MGPQNHPQGGTIQLAFLVLSFEMWTYWSAHTMDYEKQEKKLGHGIWFWYMKILLLGEIFIVKYTIKQHYMGSWFLHKCPSAWINTKKVFLKWPIVCKSFLEFTPADCHSFRRGFPVAEWLRWHRSCSYLNCPPCQSHAHVWFVVFRSSTFFMNFRNRKGPSCIN